MTMQIKDRLILLLLAVAFGGTAFADTTFKITDGVVEQQLKEWREDREAVERQCGESSH